MTHSFVVLDVETTGLVPEAEKVIELGALKIEQGVVVDQFHTLLSIDALLPKRITDLTGITEEMLRGQPKFSEISKRLYSFLEGQVLLGHNVPFDYKFIKTEFGRVGMEYEAQVLDTLEIAKKVHPELTSRSLESMCREYHIKNENAHRALADATVTAKLYFLMAERFASAYPLVFEPQIIYYKPKKDQSITNRQKNYLNDLLKYHKIDRVQTIDDLSKSEASRLIDKIISQYGRLG